MKIIVVGAGVGGLSSALALARRGAEVMILEARPCVGGLASSFEAEGLRFDGGPYVLLDRPGLEWALERLTIPVDSIGPLARLDPVYEVSFDDGSPAVRFHASAEETALELERFGAGAAQRYRRFVDRTRRIEGRLRPWLFRPPPGALDALRSAGSDLPFLLANVASVLARTRLPKPVVDALAIWTSIAGQTPRGAPSPLTLVPALFHSVGAWVPLQGFDAIPSALAQALPTGALRCGVRVTELLRRNDRVCGVRCEGGEELHADAVVCASGGVGAWLELLPGGPPPRRRRWLEGLPLQSPGVTAFLAVRGGPRSSYLRFRWGRAGCRALIDPGALTGAPRDAWRPARLVAPMDHEHATAVGERGQARHLQSLLDEPWWRENFDEARVVATRTPRSWGREFLLQRDAMNPVMTARLMRAGRLPHRVPDVHGLYLAGSATHPGQWVSFCMISGILAADLLAQDLR